ncbi:class A beta-lactamase [Actinorugispora endophytica]|uniref:Beta-lactamase n=1 Tax=Actinorugispora endophytica TaxID=1605990 RepID=A0A4R6V2V7_9ACTN|nr:class A beta-lactamase [Actinorugispora endophytica]TDQ54323.1 beta-lactamase class A [Actinorugispora endophytica]
MPIPHTRRAGAVASAALTLAFLTGCSANGHAATFESAVPAVSPAASPAESPSPYEREFERLEGEFDARLGVYAVDTGSGDTVAFNADERFAYASTHKAFSVGALLRQNSIEELERVVTYTEDDLVGHSPVTRRHVETGMTLREISDAAVRYSDNTAANLLFEELGGPEGLDAALEEIGDDVTHVDRIEPDLSDWEPGDIRDTSTPRAMATTLRAYTLGDALPEEKSAILIDLMKRNLTGDALIRAGVPDGWEVGDKTGNANYGTRNDIAVLWPPNGDPIVLAVMSSRDAEDAEHDDALIAEAAEVVVDALG